MPLYPDVKIADVLGCIADDLEFEECAYFVVPNACTVYLGSMTYDCFFNDSEQVCMILDARTVELVYKS